ncbi:Serine/threonine-protein kinase ulk3 [Balamuthia mandrillaris]
MANASVLSKAISIVTQATEHEEKHEYEEALRLYRQAIDYFMLALKYEKSERLKETIRTKVAEYISRAEQLRDYLAWCSSKGKKPVAHWSVASSIAGQAMEQEEKNEYKEALRSYQLAIEYLTQGLEYEKDARVKARIRTKAEEYLAHAERLNKFLQSQSKRPAAQIDWSEASSIARQAMEHDQKHEYEEALRLYPIAVEHLMDTLKDETDACLRARIITKAKEYLSRVEQLNNFLQSQSDKPQVEGLQSGGLATNPADTGKDGDGNTSDEHRIHKT